METQNHCSQIYILNMKMSIDLKESDYNKIDQVKRSPQILT